MIQFAHQQASTSIESPEQHSVKEIILITELYKKRSCQEVRKQVDFLPGKLTFKASMYLSDGQGFRVVIF